MLQSNIIHTCTLKQENETAALLLTGASVCSCNTAWKSSYAMRMRWG